MAEWLLEVLRELMSALLVTLALAALAGFTLWLRKSYQRFSSIDRTMQEIKKLVKRMENHERRIDRLEDRVFDPGMIREHAAKDKEWGSQDSEDSVNGT